MVSIDSAPDEPQAELGERSRSSSVNLTAGELVHVAEPGPETEMNSADRKSISIPERSNSSDTMIMTGEMSAGNADKDLEATNSASGQDASVKTGKTRTESTSADLESAMENRNRLWNIVQKAHEFFFDTGDRYQEQVELDMDELTERLERQRRVIRSLKLERKILKEHAVALEAKVEESQIRLKQATVTATNLTIEVARLSNQLPETTKDDQYFSSKFLETFLSIQSWVLRHFMYPRVNIDLLNLQGLPEELQLSLSQMLGRNWRENLSQDHLGVMEALVTEIIKKSIFEPPVLGVVGDSMTELQNHLEGSSDVMEWCMTTTRMIVSSPGFAAKVENRIQDVAVNIEEQLAPFARIHPKRGSEPRFRQLKLILKQAAEVVVECRKQPSTFSFQGFDRGGECNSALMSDANGNVGDESLHEHDNRVKLTISPAVVRTSAEPTSTPVVIVKARIMLDTNYKVRSGDAETATIGYPEI